MVDYGEPMPDSVRGPRHVNQLADVQRRIRSGDNAAVSATGNPTSPFEPRRPLVETGPDKRAQTLDTLTLQQGLILGPALTPALITASQNDYEPAGFLQAPIIRVSANAGLSITGFGRDGAGHVKALMNVGGNSITLVHESASSAVIKRLNLKGAANFTLGAGAVVWLVYDTVADKWRLIGA